jgi:haloalkane dehalogenase
MEEAFDEWIKKQLPNITMVDLGIGLHFLQEDYPHEIGNELKEWFLNI